MRVDKVRWKTIGCKSCRKFAERTRPWFQWCRSATWQAPPWRSCRSSMSPTKIVDHIPFSQHLISSVWDPNHIQEAMLLFQPNPTKQGHTNYPKRQEWAHQAMFATGESFGLWFKLITYWPNIKSTEKPRKFCRCLVFRAQNLSHVIFFVFGMSLETLICHICINPILIGVSRKYDFTTYPLQSAWAESCVLSIGPNSWLLHVWTYNVRQWHVSD